MKRPISSSTHVLARTAGLLLLAPVVIVTAACNRDRRNEGEGSTSAAQDRSDEGRITERGVPAEQAAGARVEEDTEDIAEDRAEAEKILSTANEAVRRMSSGDHGDTFRTHASDAKGVFVFPGVVKAAFGVGARGGDGVLLASHPDGTFGKPIFYDIGGASAGLQIGVEKSDIVLFVKTEEALNRAVDGALTLGANASVAVGSAPATTASQEGVANPDVVSLVESGGAFIGVSLNGTVLKPSRELNEGFHGGQSDLKTLLHEPASGAASTLSDTFRQLTGTQPSQ